MNIGMVCYASVGGSGVVATTSCSASRFGRCLATTPDRATRFRDRVRVIVPLSVDTLRHMV